MFRWVRALKQTTTYLGIFMIFAIWSGIFLLANEERERAKNEGQRQGSNLTRLLEEYISRVIKETDSQLLLLRKLYEQDPAHFNFASLTGSGRILSDLAVHFSITGTDGIIKLSSLGPIQSKIDISDIEAFKVHVSSPADELYIAKPSVGLLSGKSSIQLTRRIAAPDGSFVGVIGASLDVLLLEKFYNSIDIGRAGVITLVGFDGIIRARSGRDSTASGFIGESVADTKMFALSRQSPAGSYWNLLPSTHRFEGINRLISYRVVEDLPLVAVVALAESDIFQQATSTTHKYHQAGFLLTAIVLIAMAFGLKRQLQLSSAAAALQQTNTRLGEQTFKLDMTLNNMSQGLLALDAAKRIIILNRRYIEMYGLSPDVAKPGCTLYELISHRKETGSFVGDVEQYCAGIDTAIAKGATTSHVFETPDGRSIRIVNQPMARGGWIAMHEDISEQRRLELERDRSQKFLNTILEHAPIPIFAKDARERRYVLINRACEELWGTSRVEMMGKTSHDVFPKEEAELIAARDDELLQSSQPSFDERQILTPGNGIRSIVSKRIRVSDDDGKSLYLVGVIEDVTERKRAEEKIVHLARHDALTGIANRTVLREKLEEASERLREHREAFTVLMLDLDAFKYINDTAGHTAGDQLLKELAHRLQSSLDETETLARLGGDEFAIIQAAETNQRERAIALALKVLDVVGRPFDLDGHNVTVGASIGIALAPENGTEPGELLKKADLALYRVKSEGRNSFSFFDEEMSKDAAARHRLLNDLRAALSRNEFDLYYQPVVDAKTARPCGTEALVRWRHPVEGLVSPDRFIWLAEEAGLMGTLGEWILERACADAASWPENIKVAVNLSAAQFQTGKLFDVILCALVESGLAPERLELEITESILLQNKEGYGVMIQQLKNIGVSIVLDDFGTGYSSLSYLTRFPFDKIKIDKSFTQGISDRADCAAVVASVLTLARGLDIAVTAEGVETNEQFELLRAAGVNQLQGYLFGRPVPVAELDFSAREHKWQTGNAA
jgi:diguanylate cyclase (GGDEF)-like protein/PAS domain S-box-containing protein